MVQMSWKEFLRLTTRSIWGAPDSPRENGKGQEANSNEEQPFFAQSSSWGCRADEENRVDGPTSGKRASPILIYGDSLQL